MGSTSRAWLLTTGEAVGEDRGEVDRGRLVRTGEWATTSAYEQFAFVGLFIALSIYGVLDEGYVWD